jgi:hypothetical protein
MDYFREAWDIVVHDVEKWVEGKTSGGALKNMQLHDHYLLP